MTTRKDSDENPIKTLIEYAYAQGWRRGVSDFAWKKGGIFYVGNHAITLAEALDDGPQHSCPVRADISFNLSLSTGSKR